MALLDLPLYYDQKASDAVRGAQVTLRTRFANKEWQWEGRLVRTDASIDVDSRVVYAVVEIEQPFARDEATERPPLAPGLFVEAMSSSRLMLSLSCSSADLIMSLPFRAVGEVIFRTSFL